MNKKDGHFTEVMLIKDAKDLATFKKIYEIEEFKRNIEKYHFVVAVTGIAPRFHEAALQCRRLQIRRGRLWHKPLTKRCPFRRFGRLP